VPGQYEHNRDPHLAELLHHVTEEGWGNDSVGDLEEDGFPAGLLIIEPAELALAVDHTPAWKDSRSVESLTGDARGEWCLANKSEAALYYRE